jgi:hypothetical protein
MLNAAKKTLVWVGAKLLARVPMIRRCIAARTARPTMPGLVAVPASVTQEAAAVAAAMVNATAATANVASTARAIRQNKLHLRLRP